ncbi:MAG: response regulator transcription factor [Chloroflexi bacterium]|nr:response regulator transcription factor [Chloroflexota bacterium]
MQKIRVLVVDDHTIVRDGICSLLSLVGDIEIVGEASNGKDALEKLAQLAPDVVLMDIAMPLINGLEATRRIRKEFPHCKVLVLTQYDDREQIFSLIEAGARGFITKVAASSELAMGIRAVHRGECFLSPSVAKALVEGYQQSAARWTRDDPYEQLTDREKEVLRLIAEGYTTREVANVLVLSPKTVEGYKTNLMAKLDIHRKADLIKYAIRKGIVSP